MPKSHIGSKVFVNFFLEHVQKSIVNFHFLLDSQDLLLLGLVVSPSHTREFKPAIVMLTASEFPQNYVNRRAIVSENDIMWNTNLDELIGNEAKDK